MAGKFISPIKSRNARKSGWIKARSSLSSSLPGLKRKILRFCISGADEVSRCVKISVGLVTKVVPEKKKTFWQRGSIPGPCGSEP